MSGIMAMLLGKSSSISGASVTYAGGGGGGRYTDGGGSSGAGGSGGGGSSGTPGTSGTANTGGGGGGGEADATNGGSGGSGIVIISYPNTYPAAASTTGSPTISNTGGNRIYKFTGSGSITF